MRITKKLIDRLADLEARVAPLTAEISEIKAALKEAGAGIYPGFRFDAVVSVADTTTLDSKLVKSLLTPAQLLACSRTSPRTTIKTKARSALRSAA